MKNVFKVSLIVLSLLFFLVALTRLFTPHDKNYIFGYIPESVEQHREWTKTELGSYQREVTIKVVSLETRRDTIQCHFNDVTAPFCVVYHNDYPLSKGKKVYVKMRYDEGKFFLVDAQLEPFE